MSKATAYLVLAVILLAGLGLRGLYLHEVATNPQYQSLTADEAFNNYLAAAMLSGDWYHPDYPMTEALKSMAYIKAPGYSFFLAILQGLGLDSVASIRKIQLLLGMCNILLAYFLGRRLFDEWVGLVFAGFMATYWAFIYYEPIVHSPVLEVFLLLMFLLIIHAWLRNPGFIVALCGGLVLGVLSCIRENGLVIFLLAGAWGWWAVRRKGAALRKSVHLVFGLALGIGLTILPVTFRNYRVEDVFVPLSAQWGRNLYLGNNMQTDGVKAIIPEVETLTGSPGWNLFSYPAIAYGLSARHQRPMTSVEVDEFFFRRARYYIKYHSKEWLRLMLNKAALFWGPEEVEGDRVVHFDRLYSPVLRRIPWNFPLVVSLFLMGIFTVFYVPREVAGAHSSLNADTRKFLLLIILMVLLLSSFFILGLPQSRYRIAVIPLMLLLGAAGTVGLFREAEKKNYKIAGVIAGIGLLVLLVCSSAHTGYEPDRARWHYEQGVAYQQQGEREQALTEYKTSIYFRADFVEAMNNMAVILIEQGQAGQAEDLYRETIARFPAFIKAYVNLGALLGREGRFMEAQEVFAQAQELQPMNQMVYFNFGILLANIGEPEIAIEKFRKCLMLSPFNIEAHNNLGVLLMNAGEIQDAEKHFRMILEIQPEYPPAIENLEELQRRK